MRSKTLLAGSAVLALLTSCSNPSAPGPGGPGAGSAAGSGASGSVAKLMKDRGLSEADVAAALKTYTPSGKNDE